MLTNIIYQIHFATTGMYVYVKQHKKLKKIKNQERENALMPVTI